jgi:uridine kinase
MGSELQGMIEIKVLGKTMHRKPGVCVIDVIPERHDSDGRPYLGAVVNNRLVTLDSDLWTDSSVAPVTVANSKGANIYRRCATYVLFAAFYDLFPQLQLEIGQSMGNGYHFRVLGNAGRTPDLEALSRRMREITAEDVPFERKVMSIDAATKLFDSEGWHDKARLLRVWPASYVNTVSLGKFVDLQHGPVALSTGVIDNFELLPYDPGFILHFATDHSPIWHAKAWSPTSQLFDTYQETREWNGILGVATVGDLNEHCLNGEVRDIIHVAEGFHEKKIAAIADDIVARRPEVRLVCIAGPSSSGKTTFSKRLTTQLRVNGIRPVTVSLDDYYVNREETPRLPDGSYDFEAIEAIDLGLFNEQLVELLAGKEVATPRFDFTRGLRVDRGEWRSMRLAEDQILMIEGIHGLNDRLTEAVSASVKFRIYVSALTQLVIDSANRVGTSDARLIRRIVRDRRYRGYSAAATIASWPSVRRGERRNLFPFQDQCDVMFNSALVYEPAVLKVLAERYLLEVPREHPAASTAHALRRFLQLFVPIFPDYVPRTSIVREFIGGSAFDY